MTSIEPMGQPRVRWGILGTAAIARNKVVPGLQRSAWCDVTAVASRDVARARAMAADLGIPRAHESYDAMLDDPDIDAVYIPLPNHLHVPWSIRAAEKGKHVLCEKPIALSAREARLLLAVRDATGVQIAEAFMVRMHPQWLAARELLSTGRIGDLRLIAGHFSYYRRDPQDIRSRVEWGGGAMMDVGCYGVMLARWLFATEPSDVIALLDRDPELGVDHLGSVMMRFPSGQATFTAAGQLARHQRVTLFGSHGRIEVEIPLNAPPDRRCRIIIDDGMDTFGGGAEVVSFPAVDQYTRQGDHFARAVRGIEPFPISLEDSIANMAVIDAIFRSAETGAWEAPE